jgi:hypothetical protein
LGIKHREHKNAATGGIAFDGAPLSTQIAKNTLLYWTISNKRSPREVFGARFYCTMRLGTAQWLRGAILRGNHKKIEKLENASDCGLRGPWLRFCADQATCFNVLRPLLHRARSVRLWRCSRSRHWKNSLLVRKLRAHRIGRRFPQRAWYIRWTPNPLWDIARPGVGAYE